MILNKLKPAVHGPSSVWIRLVALALACVIGASLALAPDPAALPGLIRRFGYFFAFLSGLFFVCWALRGLIGRRRQLRPWLISHRLGLVSVLIGSWVLFVHSEFEYKIAMDDYLLAATAKTMHMERDVAYVSFGREINRQFEAISYEVDKRPWIYPFIVSGLHDLLGYHPSNPFIANALLGSFFLFFAYCFGAALGGQGAGALSVLLWASLPLLSDNANGAGMEMLNLFLLQLVLVLSADYLQAPDRLREGTLALAVLLLTCTRYESGIFAIPALIVILIGWYRRREVFISWASVASVFLLVGHLWQLRLYTLSAESWETAETVDTPMGWNHLVDNVPHALNFFAHIGNDLANSALLSLVGLVSVIALPFVYRSEWRRYWTRRPAGMALVLFAPFFILHLLLVLSFHDGRLDSLFVSRYSLPFHVLLVGATIALLSHVAVRFDWLWRYAILVALVYIHSFTLPNLLSGVSSRSNFQVNEFNWTKALAEEELSKDALFIDRFTVQWALNEYAALNPQTARISAQRIADELSEGKYHAVYVVERLQFDGADFASENPVVDELKELYALEMLHERSFRPMRMSRVYEVKGLRNE